MTVASFDHAAVPIAKVPEMAAFYRALGFEVREEQWIVTVHFGENKINMHRPELWQRESFTLRGPTAVPGCGDFCFRWLGTAEAAADLVRAAGGEIIEGPVGRVGGRNIEGISVYTRDPDGNLLEFLTYGE